MLAQGITGPRGIAHAEPNRGVAVEASFVQEPAAGHRLRRFRQLLGIEGGGCPMCLDQPGSLLTMWLRCGAGPCFLITQL